MDNIHRRERMGGESGVADGMHGGSEVAGRHAMADGNDEPKSGVPVYRSHSKSGLFTRTLKLRLDVLEMTQK